MIRPASPADEGAIVSCVRAAYAPYVKAMGREPAPMLDDYQRLIADGLVHVVGFDAKLDSGPSVDVAGLIVMWPKADHVYVDNIAVNPDGQGSGVGTALLDLADETARGLGFDEVRLYTNEAMVSNVGYYLRRGFVEAHRAVESGYRRIYFTKQVPQACPPG